MEEFFTYLSLGFHHIADPQACDHLLFVTTLCAAYPLAAWRQIFVLITAFTIGHSLTLALAALNLIHIPAMWVELLIPVTILLTGLLNVVWAKPLENNRAFSTETMPRYVLALFFGLIHGLGFSTFFRALMGDTGSIVWPLFYFNIGIELGQICIIATFFALFWSISRIKSIRHRDWNLFLSGAGAGGAIILLLKQLG